MVFGIFICPSMRASGKKLLTNFNCFHIKYAAYIIYATYSVGFDLNLNSKICCSNMASFLRTFTKLLKKQPQQKFIWNLCLVNGSIKCHPADTRRQRCATNHLNHNYSKGDDALLRHIRQHVMGEKRAMGTERLKTGTDIDQLTFPLTSIGLLVGIVLHPCIYASSSSLLVHHTRWNVGTLLESWIAAIRKRILHTDTAVSAR